MIKCNRCKELVTLNNSVYEFDKALAKLTGSEFGLVFGDCHLIPTDICPGSPSRNQYLGYPADTRLLYSYDPSKEAQFKEAYEAIRNLA